MSQPLYEYHDQVAPPCIRYPGFEMEWHKDVKSAEFVEQCAKSKYFEYAWFVSCSVGVSVISRKSTIRAIVGFLTQLDYYTMLRELGTQPGVGKPSDATANKLIFFVAARRNHCRRQVIQCVLESNLSHE